MEPNAILEEDTQHGRYLTFAMGSEVYGLEIRNVTEIVGMQPITPMPDVPACIKGVINLRGKIIPVVDMRLKFGREPMEYGARTCIIVVDIEGVFAGLIVDGVSEVLTIGDEDIVPPPDIGTGAQNRYIRAIGKVGNDVKLLLDCGRLFGGSDLELLTANGRPAIGQQAN